jgi:small subunit ribosomal protein S9
MAEDNREEPEETTPEASEEQQEQAAETERQLDPEQRIVDEPVAESEELAAEETQVESTGEAVAEAPAGTAEDAEEAEEDEEEPTPRVKPLIPGADLEVDIVREGEDALRHSDDPYAQYDEETGELIETDAEEDLSQPIADAAIDLGAGARYTATGKRKTAVARVILKPGDGTYSINGRPLDVFFPRNTLQRTIRQPLETVGYDTRMDVIASMHGGGVSAQAGALRHGISRALIEADPNLRSELKRRGFLTRDARVKERKKAGLKKARKRPQFSKR